MDDEKMMDLRVYFVAMEEIDGEDEMISASADFHAIDPYSLMANGFWSMGSGKPYYVTPGSIIGMRRLDRVEIH